MVMILGLACMLGSGSLHAVGEGNRRLFCTRQALCRPDTAGLVACAGGAVTAMAMLLLKNAGLVKPENATAIGYNGMVFFLAGFLTVMTGATTRNRGGGRPNYGDRL